MGRGGLANGFQRSAEIARHACADFGGEDQPSFARHGREVCEGIVGAGQILVEAHRADRPRAKLDSYVEMRREVLRRSAGHQRKAFQQR